MAATAVGRAQLADCSRSATDGRRMAAEQREVGCGLRLILCILFEMQGAASGSARPLVRIRCWEVTQQRLHCWFVIVDGQLALC